RRVINPVLRCGFREYCGFVTTSGSRKRIPLNRFTSFWILIKTRQMREKDHYTFSIANQPVYPHIKLTNEEFPRLLATRRLRKNDGEVFGAFLNRTSVRILIDFLNRTF